MLHFLRKQKKQKLKVQTFQNDPITKQSELNVAVLIFCQRKKKKKKKARENYNHGISSHNLNYIYVSVCGYKEIFTFMDVLGI